jgi:hypothetical protein
MKRFISVTSFILRSLGSSERDRADGSADEQHGGDEGTGESNGAAAKVVGEEHDEIPLNVAHTDNRVDANVFAGTVPNGFSLMFSATAYANVCVLGTFHTEAW